MVCQMRFIALVLQRHLLTHLLSCAPHERGFRILHVKLQFPDIDMVDFMLPT